MLLYFFFFHILVVVHVHVKKIAYYSAEEAIKLPQKFGKFHIHSRLEALSYNKLN